ncbi:MAG: CvpA family protein [Gammaproteobacteria bacterium]|nr:CvpA family protein [Gammaproteobacteria bacterium]MCZ6856197.1 CvpA family protein [Gammaproteobacteria bacterium]
MNELVGADIVILIVILVSALIGLARGIFKEVLSLASWFAAFILALYFAPALRTHISTELGDESVRLVIAFTLIFVVTLIVGSLVQWLVAKVVKDTGLSGTDRFLGFLFGSARGLLVCIIALIAMKPFADESTWWHTSVITPELLAFEQDVLKLMGKARDVVTRVSSQR